MRGSTGDEPPVSWKSIAALEPGDFPGGRVWELVDLEEEGGALFDGGGPALEVGVAGGGDALDGQAQGGFDVEGLAVELDVAGGGAEGGILGPGAGLAGYLGGVVGEGETHGVGVVAFVADE